MTYFINEKELPVIEKSKHLVSFNFADNQLLDLMKFFRGATTLDSFLKAYKASEMKGYFPYKWFHTPYKLDEKQLPSYDDFYSKFGLKTKPLTGFENYNYLKSIWKHEQMSTFFYSV